MEFESWMNGISKARLRASKPALNASNRSTEMSTTTAAFSFVSVTCMRFFSSVSKCFLQAGFHNWCLRPLWPDTTTFTSWVFMPSSNTPQVRLATAQSSQVHVQSVQRKVQNIFAKSAKTFCCGFDRPQNSTGWVELLHTPNLQHWMSFPLPPQSPEVFFREACAVTCPE